MKRNKYGNKKVTVDGQTYDSKLEYQRYCDLKVLEKAGVISDIQRQVVFELQPKFLNKETGRYERAIKYIADFTYMQNGEMVIEDSKSEITRRDKVYRLKRKMMAYRGYYIKEV